MMSERDHVTDSLADLGDSLREQPSLKDRIVQRLAETDTGPDVTPRQRFPSRAAKGVAGIAACALLILTLCLMTGHEDASQVYAAAMECVRQARTFSCRSIDSTTADGQARVTEELIMFKEPDLERRVLVKSPFPQFNGEVTVTDYARSQILRVVPSEKTAYLRERSSSYEVVDESTGKLKLKPRELDTSIRDRLLQWSKEDVDDLGRVDLQGQSVRLLRTRWGNWSVKTWIAPKSKLPLQVRLQLQDDPGTHTTYTSIQIDTDLNDNLFSLEPPEGYRLKKIETGDTGWPDDKSKLSTKMSYLVRACYRFADKHDGEFPKKLSDLKEVGIGEEVLRNVLAAPGEPDGPALIRYRPPPADADSRTYILLHETHDEPSQGGVVACFLDGHREILVDERRIEQLLR